VLVALAARKEIMMALDQVVQMEVILYLLL
jgi:hypothetical protein